MNYSKWIEKRVRNGENIAESDGFVANRISIALSWCLRMNQSRSRCTSVDQGRLIQAVCRCWARQRGSLGDHGLDHGSKSQALYIKIYILSWFKLNPIHFFFKFDPAWPNFYLLWPRSNPILNQNFFFLILIYN